MGYYITFIVVVIPFGRCLSLGPIIVSITIDMCVCIYVYKHLYSVDEIQFWHMGIAEVRSRASDLASLDAFQLVSATNIYTHLFIVILKLSTF